MHVGFGALTAVVSKFSIFGGTKEYSGLEINKRFQTDMKPPPSGRRISQEGN
jgi:hypothetical protein